MKFEKIREFIIPIFCLALVNSANASILLSDDFDDTSLSSTWHVEQGFADVSNGYVDIHGSTPGSRDGWIVAAEGSSWSNYHFSTHFIADGGGNNWYHGDIAFRVQDLHPSITGTFYRVLVDTPIWGGGAGHGMISLIRVVDGVGSVVESASPSPGIVAGRNNLVDVWAVDNHFQVAINGTQVIDFIDPAPILTGGIALGAIWESHVRYDYAFVGSISPVPEPQQWLMLLLGGIGLITYQLRCKHDQRETEGFSSASVV